MDEVMIKLNLERGVRINVAEKEGKKVCFRKMEHRQKPQVMGDIVCFRNSSSWHCLSR